MSTPNTQKKLRMEALGAAFAKRRVRMAMSRQDQLASAAGVGVRTISDIETGKTVPRVITMRKIEAALQLPPGTSDKFLSGEISELPDTPAPRRAEEPTPAREWSATERARMRDMPMTEVQATHDLFRRKSEYLADVWLREVMRVKAEAETASPSHATER
jgi:transcriptional regulator with XRE-family HTH domain